MQSTQLGSFAHLAYFVAAEDKKEISIERKETPKFIFVRGSLSFCDTTLLHSPLLP